MLRYETGRNTIRPCLYYHRYGVRHRTDGPAFIQCIINMPWWTVEWCQYGKLHRVNRPAVIFKTGSHVYHRGVKI